MYLVRELDREEALVTRNADLHAAQERLAVSSGIVPHTELPPPPPSVPLAVPLVSGGASTVESPDVLVHASNSVVPPSEARVASAFRRSMWFMPG